MKKIHSYLAFICCFILFILCLCACDSNAQQIVTTTEHDVVERTTDYDDQTALEGPVSILKDIGTKSKVASQRNAASKEDEIQVEVTTTEQIFYEEYVPYEGTVDYYEEVYEQEQELVEQETEYEESVYSSITWADCIQAAANIGMDEYSLCVMTGWTVREGYAWCDSYLAQLCAYCPLYYWARGENIGWGLSGYGNDPTYSDEGLIWYSYSVSNYELEFIYYALTNPRYDIFECNGVSWYDGSDGTYLIYSSCGINVWGR